MVTASSAPELALSEGPVQEGADCALCGKRRAQVLQMFVGVGGCVCADCVSRCHRILQDMSPAPSRGAA